VLKESLNTPKILNKKKIDHFTKRYPQAIEYFGERGATMFGYLEFLYKSSKRPFYKFIEPCKHKLCKKGDTFSEVLILNKRAVLRGLDKIRISYKSKPLYLKALKELGEDGVFQGRPFLSYQDGSTYLTTYDMNPRIVKEILDRKWVNLSDIVSDKCAPQPSDKCAPRYSSQPQLPQGFDDPLIDYYTKNNTPLPLDYSTPAREEVVSTIEEGGDKKNIEERNIPPKPEVILPHASPPPPAEEVQAILHPLKATTALREDPLALMSADFRKIWPDYPKKASVGTIRDILGLILQAHQIPFAELCSYATSYVKRKLATDPEKDLIGPSQWLKEAMWKEEKAHVEPVPTACQIAHQNELEGKKIEQKFIENSQETQEIKKVRLQFLNFWPLEDYRQYLKQALMDVGGDTLTILPVMRYHAKQISYLLDLMKKKDAVLYPLNIKLIRVFHYEIINDKAVQFDKNFETSSDNFSSLSGERLGTLPPPLRKKQDQHQNLKAA
jgi:hypothetical protein